MDTLKVGDTFSFDTGRRYHPTEKQIIECEIIAKAYDNVCFESWIYAIHIRDKVRNLEYVITTYYPDEQSIMAAYDAPNAINKHHYNPNRNWLNVLRTQIEGME